jgi:(1->4)-alpha-D-glucan 1-alpha-D-glucosylmutase
VTWWGERNERHRSEGWPDRNAEYLLYQTLVGAWPVDTARAQAFLEKATKEPKVHTSWIDPRPDYDEALAALVAGVLADEPSSPNWRDSSRSTASSSGAG